MQADRLRYISVRNTIQTAKAGNKTSRGLSRKCNHCAIAKHARMVLQEKKRKMEDEISLVWNGKTNKKQARILVKNDVSGDALRYKNGEKCRSVALKHC